MVETITLQAADAKKMAQIGHSLAKCLYTETLNIFLHGELGAGKTTLLQGFLKSLGIEESVTSPTYALEQRYVSKAGMPLIHLDLYRLSSDQAATVCMQSNDEPGIRCIEWSERLENKPSHKSSIDIHIKEDAKFERTVTIAFNDVRVPSQELLQQWRTAVALPNPVARHCDAVGVLAKRLGNELLKEAFAVRPELVAVAGQLHDLFRFIDFRPGAAHIEEEFSEDTQKKWAEWKLRFEGLSHEAACAQFLQEEGYEALSLIIATHGLALPPDVNATTEQKLLYYADKRVRLDTVVSLDERFADFENRYANGQSTPNGTRWKKESLAMERALFPNGVPF